MTTNHKFKIGDLCRHYLPVSKIDMLMRVIAEPQYYGGVLELRRRVRVIRTTPETPSLHEQEFNFYESVLIPYQEPLDILKEML